MVRTRLGALVTAALLAAPVTLCAQTITIRAGSAARTQAPPGTKIEVPIVADLSTAGGTILASITTGVSWGASRLTLDSVKTAGFGTLTANTTNAGSGSLSFSVFDAAGATNTVTLATVYFTTSATTGGTTIALTPTAAGNAAGASVFGLLRVRNLDACVAPSGKWGDVNDDGNVNIIDAQQIARYTVGLSVANIAAVQSRGDVTADASVNIIDAQQLARHSVQLSAPARVGTLLFATPSIGSVVVSPPSATLSLAQAMMLSATPSDTTTNPVNGCVPVTWSSSDTTIAAVDTTGRVAARALGTATITASAGGKSGTTAITVSVEGAPASLTIVQGEDQYGFYGSSVPVDPVVVVRDAAGAPVPNVSVLYTVQPGGGTISGLTRPNTIVITDAAGEARLAGVWIAPSTGTTATLTAVAGVLPGVTFTTHLIPGAPGSHTCLLASGRVYCVGNNARGQLGDGTNVNRTSLVQVVGGITFAQLSSNGYGDRACALASSGSAYCWGFNAGGGLGDGTRTDRNVPTLVTGGHTFTRITTGTSHTCALDAAGDAWCWGHNPYGQMGDGSLGASYTQPMRVTAPQDVFFTDISAGGNHTCAVATSGELWCWGRNAESQLGDGKSVNRLVPVPVGGSLTFARVSSGATHTCALMGDGTARCWGSNGDGELGDGTLANRVTPMPVAGGHQFVEIKAGPYHTCATKNDGEVWCWGYNSQGQVGDGSFATRTSPVLIPVTGSQLFTGSGNGHTCLVHAAGSAAFCWGSNNQGQLGDGSTINRPVPTSVTQPGATAGAAASVTASMQSVSQSGVSGIAVTVNPTVNVRDGLGGPVSGVTVSFSVVSGGGTIQNASAISDANGQANGGTWTTGPTAGANLLRASITLPGGAGIATAYFVAFATPAPVSIVKIAGDSLLVPNQGYVVFNVPPTVRVVDGTNQPVANARVTFTLGANSGSSQFATGGTAVVLTDASGLASFRYWTVNAGSNAVSTLTAFVAGVAGAVTFTEIHQPGASIISDRQYACEIASAGTVYCWGSGTVGQLGDGSGAAMRGYAVPVSGGQTFASLANGQGDHKCALTAGGQAWCWGANWAGQIGDGTTTQRNVPTLVTGGLTFTQIVAHAQTTCGLTTGGQAYCWGWMGSAGFLNPSLRGKAKTTPMLVNAGAVTFTALALGDDNFCGLAAGGTLHCLGTANYGATGDGTMEFTGVLAPVAGGLSFAKVSGGTSNFCAITTAGRLYCWGIGQSGSNADGTTNTRNVPTEASTLATFADVSSGNLGSCALTSAGTAWCWGNNGSGQAGQGYVGSVFTPLAISGWTFTTIRDVGFRTVCGKVVNGQLYCWGGNQGGELGDSTAVLSRGSPVPVTRWPDGPAAGVPVGLAATSAWAGGQSGVPSGPTTDAPAVIVKDRFGTPVAGVQVTFTVTSGGGSLASTGATSDVNGVATAGVWTLGPQSGVNTVAASASGVPPVILSATSNAVTLSYYAGDNQYQAVGASWYPASLTVIVKDAANTPIQGIQVQWAITSGGGAVSATATSTNASGLTSVQLTPPSSISGYVATQSVVANFYNGLGTVTFTAHPVSGFGNDTRCELTSTGAAYCWGVNARGQVGNGTTSNVLVPTAVGGGNVFASLADGIGDHACGLTTGGAAFCWGANSFGQLGDGTTTDRAAPTAVSGGFTFTKLVLSNMTTCGLTTGGTIRCWGWASFGFFGDGALGTIQPTPTLVQTSGVTFTDISISTVNICGVASDASLYCWGANNYGQIGDASLTQRSAPVRVNDGRTYSSVALGYWYSCALTTTGAAFCWGYNGNGQLGDGTNTQRTQPTAVAGGLTFASITVGQNFTCAVTVAGTAWCWGLNANGQLGDGTTTARNAPTAVLGGIAFASLRARNFTTCGRAIGGQPFCWGRGSSGQLGNGTTTGTASIPVPVTWVEGTPGVAASVVISAGNNQTATAGTNVGTAPSVLVRDFAGNAVSGTAVTFTVTSGGGSVTGGTATTNASGIATVGSWTLGATPGANTITATIAGVGTVKFTTTGN